jgi:hypothetical protein
MPDPVTVSEKFGEPAVIVAGPIEVSVGTGLTTGRASGFEAFPELRTIKDSDPTDVRYCVPRVKLTDCDERNVVG